jgi:hypothetical protein
VGLRVTVGVEVGLLVGEAVGVLLVEAVGVRVGAEGVLVAAGLEGLLFAGQPWRRKVEKGRASKNKRCLVFTTRSVPKVGEVIKGMRV